MIVLKIIVGLLLGYLLCLLMSMAYEGFTKGSSSLKELALQAIIVEVAIVILGAIIFFSCLFLAS